MNLKDYDKVFENDVERDFFYNAPGYRGNKLVVGVIGLENAIERLKKDEYYLLVKYNEGDILPKEYIENAGAGKDGTLFASVNPKVYLTDICKDGGIQRISSLDKEEYLLGPGPDTFSMSDLIKESINQYDQQCEKENIQGNVK